MAISDPLEGLESRPQAAQIGILASVLRGTLNELGEMKDDIKGVKFALWGLLAGMFLATFGIIATLLVTRPA